jgi:hypothetical protein
MVSTIDNILARTYKTENNDSFTLIEYMIFPFNSYYPYSGTNTAIVSATEIKTAKPNTIEEKNPFTFVIVSPY